MLVIMPSGVMALCITDQLTEQGLGFQHILSPSPPYRDGHNRLPRLAAGLFIGSIELDTGATEKAFTYGPGHDLASWRDRFKSR
ncbi:MAG: hypothetical protein B7Z29_07960 [Hyphomicrobium sp. 12-62-95]|nr:MAG: hypothetical protein B7Z29_07960 [Hyphomicrobium sp. 12-62-95]